MMLGQQPIIILKERTKQEKEKKGKRQIKKPKMSVHMKTRSGKGKAY